MVTKVITVAIVVKLLKAFSGELLVRRLMGVSLKKMMKMTDRKEMITKIRMMKMQPTNEINQKKLKKPRRKRERRRI